MNEGEKTRPIKKKKIFIDRIVSIFVIDSVRRNPFLFLRPFR